MVPGTIGSYFYGGYCYRFHGGHWFRAVTFNDPGFPVQIGLVPDPVVVVPHDYILNMPPGYHRIGYHDFLVIGGIGSAVATGMGRIGIGAIPGVIGRDKRFHRPPPGHPGHRGPYGKQWLEGLEDHMENQVDTGLMEDQVDQGLVARRVGRVVPTDSP